MTTQIRVATCRLLNLEDKINTVELGYNVKNGTVNSEEFIVPQNI